MKKRLLLAAVVASAVLGAQAEPNGLVVLLTDYGADSIYVGILKGAIYAKWGDAKVDTLTNSVPPFDIEAGAVLLGEGASEYPKGTTFCCVVDPGVGTSRKCIVLETKAGQYFVAPDNGLLTVVKSRGGVVALHEATNRDHWRPGVESSTFHGRDIFGPVSAAVAGGVAVADVGPRLSRMQELNIPAPGVSGNTIRGRVRRVDPYGNVVTDITSDMLGMLGILPGDMLEVRIGDSAFQAVRAATYAAVPAGQPLVLVQSSGYVECAINRGNMAESVGAQFHTPVTIGTEKQDNVLVDVARTQDGSELWAVTVYPSGMSEVRRNDFRREFALSEARLEALKERVDALDMRALRGAPKPAAGAPAIVIRLGTESFRLDDAGLPPDVESLADTMRNLYRTQMRAFLKPQVSSP